MSHQTTNALYVYDIVLSCQHNSFETVKKAAQEWAKAWVFQKEEGDEVKDPETQKGFLHWQCRWSLIKPQRKQELVRKLRTYGLKFSEAAIRPTSSAVAGTKAQFQYAMKADTRVEGPWTDKDIEKFLNKGVRWINEHGIEPWQESILESLKEYDHRSINMLIDTRGNLGKTNFEDWLEYYEHSFALWWDDDSKRMMESAYANAGRKCFTIGIPRAVNAKEFKSFWSMCENLKDGRVIDGRYKAKRQRMERPHIWIFSNTLPSMGDMSLDRWKFWTVEDRELVPYDITGDE